MQCDSYIDSGWTFFLTALLCTHWDRRGKEKGPIDMEALEQREKERWRQGEGKEEQDSEEKTQKISPALRRVSAGGHRSEPSVAGNVHLLSVCLVTDLLMGPRSQHLKCSQADFLEQRFSTWTSRGLEWCSSARGPRGRGSSLSAENLVEMPTLRLCPLCGSDPREVAPSPLLRSSHSCSGVENHCCRMTDKNGGAYKLLDFHPHTTRNRILSFHQVLKKNPGSCYLLEAKNFPLWSTLCCCAEVKRMLFAPCALAAASKQPITCEITCSQAENQLRLGVWSVSLLFRSLTWFPVAHKRL